MMRLTLTQMRLNAGRLAAAGVAVVLGTAFMAATMLAGGLLKATMHDAVSASYRGADVVVSEADAPPTLLTAVRALPQVDGADPADVTMVELVAGDRSDTPIIAPVATTPALRTVSAGTGRLPERTGEIALSADLASRLRLGVGDQVIARTRTWPAGGDASPTTSDEAGTTPVVHDTRVTVVGVARQGSGFGLDPDAFAVPDQLAAWDVEQGNGTSVADLLVHAAPGVSAEQARAAVAGLPGWGTALIRTGEQQTEIDTRELTEDVDVLTAGLLAFAGIALFVAGLVITNTFQVLVAQRTRALALLRCVGATRRQIRRSVLLEAGLLGTAASVLGLLAGTALVMIAAAVLSSMDLRVKVPATVQPDLLSVLAPLVVGVLVTVLAALSPARAATRVAPVAALRPLQPGGLRSRGSVLRMVFAALLLLAGAGLLAVGVAMSSTTESVDGLLPAMAGGALSFLGVLVGGSLFIPRLIGVAGRVTGRWGGVPARVAAANAVRNPRRTATTSAALLIGVTLVATMSTGAAVVTATLDRELDNTFPVDALIGFMPDGPSSEAGAASSEVPAGVAPAVTQVPGVAAVSVLTGGRARLSVGQDRLAPPDQDPQAAPATWVGVYGADPARTATVVRSTTGTAGLAPGRAVVPHRVADDLKLRDGDRFTLAVDGRTADLQAQVTSLAWDGVLLTPQDLRTLLPKAPATMLWLRLDTADAKGTVKDVQEAVVTATGSQTSVPVAGVAVERATYEQVIGTLLLVVTALLAVAVVIALIGVANTLSLSVIERTRESAVLRALGLTRRQLRAMLAVEGALIAGIGALIGIVLGTVYGWAGAASVIGGVWRPELALPLRDLTLLLAGGVLAGLLASALPGRRAARTPPVTALGE